MEEEDLEKFSLSSWKHSLLSFILSMRKLRPRGEVTCLESPSWLVTEKGWDLSRVPASLILGLSWERLLFFAALSLNNPSVCGQVSLEETGRLRISLCWSTASQDAASHTEVSCLTVAVWGIHKQVGELVSHFASWEQFPSLRLWVKFLFGKHPSSKVLHSDQPKNSPRSKYLVSKVPEWLLNPSLLKVSVLWWL